LANETFERGLAVRSAVLGAEHVRRSMTEADEFSRPIQELATEYAWGAVWGREGLPRRDRSLLNIGMISALNRPHELKLHIKAALTNGLTRDEIREALLQVAVYCGMPAGLDSHRIAREAFAELDTDAAAEGGAR
jgi:4-carboxymuconolactone decarboxylase